MTTSIWDRVRLDLPPRRILCALAKVDSVSELAERLALFDRPTTRSGLSKALGDAERHGWLKLELAEALAKACAISVREVYEVCGAADVYDARMGR